MKNKPLKLCGNCKFSDINSGLEDFWKCNAPQNLANTLSNKTRRWEFCNTHRSQPWFIALIFRQCGIRGRWFEPKNK